MSKMREAQGLVEVEVTITSSPLFFLLEAYVGVILKFCAMCFVIASKFM